MSQENFEKNVFLTTKYEQIVKLEHLLCPKVGGGGTNPLVPPPLSLKVGRHVPPLPPSPTPLVTLNRKSQGQSHIERLQLMRSDQGLYINMQSIMPVIIYMNDSKLKCNDNN